MTPNHLASLSVLCASVLGCSSITTSRASLDATYAPAGVPWVESRLYEVHVYQGHRANNVAAPVLMYFGRQYLADKVNGAVIDDTRPRWQTNYSVAPFTDASLTMKFHTNGTLSEAELATGDATAGAAKVMTTAFDTAEKIKNRDQAEKKEELDRLKLEKELRDAREALRPKE